jgi:hypothetical protein
MDEERDVLTMEHIQTIEEALVSTQRQIEEREREREERRARERAYPYRRRGGQYLIEKCKI